MDGILSNTFWARFSIVLSAKIFPAILKPVMTASVMRHLMTALLLMTLKTMPSEPKATSSTQVSFSAT